MKAGKYLRYFKYKTKWIRENSPFAQYTLQSIEWMKYSKYEVKKSSWLTSKDDDKDDDVDEGKPFKIH